MMHEHLAPRDVSEAPRGRTRFFRTQDLASQVSEVEDLARRGVGTVVDVTPSGKGRDPVALREISTRTGVHVIAATGFYKEPACPPLAHRGTVADLVAFMVGEAESGIEGSDILPGIIKVGSSKGTITPTEAKVFAAAARVQRRTGLPITTHTTLGTMGREQVDLLVAEGADPARIVIGHCDLNVEPAYHLEILKTGATVAFDTIGKETFRYRRHQGTGYHRYAFLLEEYHIPDRSRSTTLLALLHAGYASQIVLSLDLLWREGLDNPDTTGTWGYGYLFERFLPRMRDAGVGDDEIATMMVENPRRILSGS